MYVIFFLLIILILILEVSVWPNMHLINTNGDVPVVCYYDLMSKTNRSFSGQYLAHPVCIPHSLLVCPQKTFGCAGH